MPAWANGNLTVYHATDRQNLAAYGTLFGTGQRVSSYAVKLSLCRQATDFGQGFYTTTSLHQAREYANARVRRLAAAATPVLTQGLILQFDLDRDWLAAQETLFFVRAIQDYWDFVTHCRAGLAVHNRPWPRGPYDVVCGLVTIWPQCVLILDCDQISFHTDRAVMGLRKPIVADVASGADGGLFL
jgi:hypothetical protein